MQLTNKQSAALVSFLFAVVALLGAFFGWEIKGAPTATQSQQIGALTSGTNLDNLALSGTLDVAGVTTLGTANVTTVNATSLAGTLSTAAQPNITSLGTLSSLNATSATVTTGTLTSLSLGGATFSGPVKYGNSATYTSAAAITHGFAVTPTMCIIWPTQNVTNTITLGATTFSSNMASTSNPIYWMCGK